MSELGVIPKLKSLEPALKARGVKALHLFGSQSRGTATAQSDIDVFVDPADETFFKFENFMAVFGVIEDAFPGHAIGYGTRNGLSPHIRPIIEREAIQIF